MTLALKNAAGTTISTDTVDLPLESVVVNGSYDSTNKKIVLTLQSGSTIDIPVGDLVSGLQEEITSSNKLSADLVDDTNTTNKFFSGDYDDLNNKPVVAKTIKTYANMQEKPFDFSTAEIGSYINTYENWFCYKTGSFSVRRIGSADFVISEFVINKTVADATDNEIIGYAFGFQNNIETGSQKTVNGARCQFNIIKQSSGEVIIDTSVYTVNNVNYITGGYQKIFGEKELEYAPKLASYTAPTIDTQLAAKKYVDDKVAKYTTMPTSMSTTDLGKVVQYVGTTNLDFTKGHFYEVIQGESSAYTWQEITVDDLSGKQDTIDSSHKLSADLVDDSTATNKFVTTSDKTTWSGKQDALVSGTNIKTINNTSLLGSGNIEVSASYDLISEEEIDELFDGPTPPPTPAITIDLRTFSSHWGNTWSTNDAELATELIGIWTAQQDTLAEIIISNNASVEGTLTGFDGNVSNRTMNLLAQPGFSILIAGTDYIQITQAS